MNSNVSIVEVSPRDGLQSEPEVLETHQKVQLIERAIGAGIKRLEVASFVHPQRVPQMADAESVIEQLPQTDDVSYIGLLLNERGLDRALETKVHEIGMVIVASDTYNRSNQGMSTDESIAAWLKIAKRAKAHGLRANVMISAVFGCPFEGEIEPAHVMELAHRVMEAEPFELGVADSIGVAVPAQVTALLADLRQQFAGTPLRCHFHNTRNTGFANAMAAVAAGAVSLDASIGGIGGCPFAPAATGNIATEDLVYMLQRSGLANGYALERLMESSKWLEGILGRPVPAMLPHAGVFPPKGASNGADADSRP